MQRIVSILIVIALGVAALWSVRLSRADAAFRAGSLKSVARAIELLPQNTTYLAVGALQAEYEERDSAEMLERIASLNPASSAPRIRLGLAAESRGDVGQAEKWLADAYRVDRQFDTRWTLANFYLRQGRTDDFWKWIRSALEMSYGDRRPAFELCWRMSQDPQEIQRAIPDPAREAYLLYVLEKGRVDAVVGAAAGVQNKPLLFAATESLLQVGRFADGVAVWKLAGEREPQGVTSPHLEQAGAGFGWKFDASEGVVHQQLEGGRGHRVRLSGKQGEVTRLLGQFVGGLHSGVRYRLVANMEGAPKGLEWRIAGQISTGEFVAPAEVALLELWYVRPRGEVRAEATFDLTEVTVSALQ